MSLALFFFHPPSSILFRRFLSIGSSSSFRTHADFISRARSFLGTLPRFPSRHYSPAVSSTSISSSLSPPFAAVSARCNALSSYVPPILYPFTLPLARLTKMSEGHWNRIKLYAGFSMPPFPLAAMKGGIRHSGRSQAGRNGEISFERGRTKFPWPFIRRPDAGSATEKVKRSHFNSSRRDSLQRTDRQS